MTVNGCFDGITPGHLFLFGYALAHGDALVVGLNSDEYIMRKKRPVPFYTEAQRVAMLRKFPFVHDVVVFREDGPSDFIRRVRPVAHCIGDEYRGRAVEEPTCAELGVKLVFAPRLPAWSSSAARGATVVEP